MNRYTWTLNWGTLTLKRGAWRLQLYWPYLRARHVHSQRNYREFVASADSVLRLASEDGYFGAGIQLFGFGMAVDHFERSAK